MLSTDINVTFGKERKKVNKRCSGNEFDGKEKREIWKEEKTRDFRQANLMPRRRAADEGRDARGGGERRGSGPRMGGVPGAAAGDRAVWRATVGEPV